MILTELVSDHPGNLADLALTARPREYPILIAKLKELGQRGEDAMHSEFAVQIPETATLDIRFSVERRKAYAAVSLIEFEKTEPLQDVLVAPVDSMLCTYAEDRLGSLGLHPENLLRLMNHASTDLKAALLRSLGGMKVEHFPQELRSSLFNTVERVFQTDPNPGVHSAAQWALRSWEQSDRLKERMKELMSAGPMANHRWYINSQGQTMIVFKGPVESRVGSPSIELGHDSDENPCALVINRDFAVCSTEITREQFLNLIPNFRHTRRDYSPTDDSPIAYPNWYRAAEYCNLLSEKEGLPADQFCYGFDVPTVNHPEGKINVTLQPKPNCLALTGYRLLTEAEWEFACRGGTTTAFCWGDDPSVALRYARALAPLPLPVGSFCPNRYGLFDMHGNVSEWTHDIYFDGPRTSGIDSDKDVKEYDFEAKRAVRGGHTLELIPYLRSANRAGNSSYGGVSARLGFRIGRTMPPESR
jgi:formylglycine-generating enzyme required for sulfatase activity